MRLGARHRRLFGHRRPLQAAVRAGAPSNHHCVHHVIKWGQRGCVAFPSSRYWRRSELNAIRDRSETSWNVMDLISYVQRSRRRRRGKIAWKGKERKIRQRQDKKGRVNVPMNDGERGRVNTRKRKPFVDRSSAQELKRCVLLSKGRRLLQHILRPHGGPRLFTGRGASSVTGVVSVGFPRPEIASPWGTHRVYSRRSSAVASRWHNVVRNRSCENLRKPLKWTMKSCT